MAEQVGKFLTELPELTTPIEDDLMYIVDDDTSKKITLKNLKSVVGGEDVTGTASGTVATFIDGGDDKPLKECEVSIEATQSGSGTPSPSNVRPIVGRSEVNINVEGRNRFEITMSSYTTSGVTATVADGYITLSGTASANITMNMRTNRINFSEIGDLYKLVDDGNFTFSANTIYLNIRYYDENGSAISNQALNSGKEMDLTIPSNAVTYMPMIIIRSGVTANGTIKPMLILKTDTETTFESYNGSITTISLGRTVYGGTLDVVRGVLKVTDKYFTYSSCTMYGQYQGHQLFYVDIPNYSTEPIANIGDGTSTAELTSNMFTKVSGTTMLDGEIRTQQQNTPTRFYFNWDSATTEAEMNDILAQDNLQVVAELATPQTYTLTPEEVSTILGYNNISADSGDVIAVYVRDLNITINDLINRVTALENE